MEKSKVRKITFSKHKIFFQQLEDVMDMLKLGPNGALMYCMEFLETNFEWLISSIRKFPTEKYFLFDFPGQVTV